MKILFQNCNVFFSELIKELPISENVSCKLCETLTPALCHLIPRCARLMRVEIKVKSVWARMVDQLGAESDGWLDQELRLLFPAPKRLVEIRTCVRQVVKVRVRSCCVFKMKRDGMFNPGIASKGRHAISRHGLEDCG